MIVLPLSDLRYMREGVVRVEPLDSSGECVRFYPTWVDMVNVFSERERTLFIQPQGYVYTYTYKGVQETYLIVFWVDGNGCNRYENQPICEPLGGHKTEPNVLSRGFRFNGLLRLTWSDVWSNMNLGAGSTILPWLVERIYEPIRTVGIDENKVCIETTNQCWTLFGYWLGGSRSNLDIENFYVVVFVGPYVRGKAPTLGYREKDLRERDIFVLGIKDGECERKGTYTHMVTDWLNHGQLWVLRSVVDSLS